MATTKPAPVPVPSKQPAPVGGASRRPMNFLRGIREGDPVVWKELLEEVKKAQGNLEEVARRVGVSRETLRRWENRHERLREAVEKAVGGNVMLARQRKAWTPERKKAVAERERKHQQALGVLEGSSWEPNATSPLPPGVVVGKRAILSVPVLDRSFLVLVFVMRTTAKKVQVVFWSKNGGRVRRVSPKKLQAWPEEERGFRRVELEWLATLEREHKERFFPSKKAV